MSHPFSTAPHYLLLTQAQTGVDSENRGGVWRFVLEEIGSDHRTEVTEQEPGVWGERLQLLAVVRGLEALEQIARVTLITPSRMIGNGIRNGLAIWRENGWQWEDLGKMSPITHCDLWKRIDHAMQFHQVDCRVWDFEENHFRASRPAGRHRISFNEIQNARRLSYSNETEHHPAPFRTNKLQISTENHGRCAVASHKGEQNSAIGNSMDRLADRIKPIGQGRAFGYVPN